jgi:hypothetical protein
LSLRLKWSVGTLLEVLIGTALSVTLAVAVLAMFARVAEAQGTAPTKYGPMRVMVVEPGDSLWSISEQRLGSRVARRSANSHVQWTRSGRR